MTRGQERTAGRRKKSQRKGGRKKKRKVREKGVGGKGD